MKMEAKNGIKAFRDRLGIKSQSELARILGVKPQNVSVWESGKGNPSFAQAKKMFEMGATAEELFGVAYGKSPASSSEEFKELVKEQVYAVLSEGVGEGTIQIKVKG